MPRRVIGLHPMQSTDLRPSRKVGRNLEYRTANPTQRIAHHHFYTTFQRLHLEPEYLIDCMLHINAMWHCRQEELEARAVENWLGKIGDCKVDSPHFRIVMGQLFI